MKKLFASCEIIDFYFSKLESYLSKKHKNIFQRSSMSGTDSICSESPRSDRNNTEEDEKKVEGNEGDFGSFGEKA